MRITSPVMLGALTRAFALALLVQSGVLACGASDSDAGGSVAGASGAVSAAGAVSVAGAGGADASAAGSAGSIGGGGASSAGTAGALGNAGTSGSSGSSGAASSAGSGGSAGIGGAAGTGGSGGAAPFALTSPAFTAHAACGTAKISACDTIDAQFELQTIGGMNHSPELNWTAGPPGTQSYAVALFDESNSYTHWVLWNIPATADQLPASLPAGDAPAGLTGAKQISFNGDGTAYAGPGAKSHVYQFKLYALKIAALSISLGTTDKQTAARKALEASTDVIGTSILRAATAP